MNAHNLQTVSMGGQKFHYTMGSHIFYWGQVVEWMKIETKRKDVTLH